MPGLGEERRLPKIEIFHDIFYTDSDQHSFRISLWATLAHGNPPVFMLILQKRTCFPKNE